MRRCCRKIVFRGNICCFQKKYCPPLLHICQISAFTPKSRREVENIKKSSKDCYLGLWTMWTIVKNGSRDENLNWKILNTLSLSVSPLDTTETHWHKKYFLRKCWPISQSRTMGAIARILSLWQKEHLFCFKLAIVNVFVLVIFDDLAQNHNSICRWINKQEI